MQHHDDCNRSDPLAALRGATAHQHAILDTGLPLAQADATLQDYRDHLLMLRAWLTPIEAWLARLRRRAAGAGRAAAGRAQPADRRRPGDRRAGAAVGPRRTQRQPLGRHDASAAYRWGVCYVVEGSQLGGVVLYRRLAAQLAPHPLNYLKGSADGPGPRWRAFSEALRGQVRGSEQVAEACAGACAAFDRILALRTPRY